ncbi:hypothetical protein [Bradyrhizobium sp. 2S1]|uniref:hypothetical protein n=1 Tax=Bradyrhizobium sp. 2S1 TaxID=1404429 RepID=UPI00140E3257|nr:hypothetical protein [Bradyrhizobium sp. 2S1]MCK7670313.1 hypothetical protein [Bradyrhizobium sp. 2S1]
MSDLFNRKQATKNPIGVPEDLADQITNLLKKKPAWRWDEAVSAMAEQAADKPSATLDDELDLPPALDRRKKAKS